MDIGLELTYIRSEASGATTAANNVKDSNYNTRLRIQRNF
jgi:hypothetical protein